MIAMRARRQNINPDGRMVAACGLRQRVTWKNAGLAKVPQEDIMIRIHLENAEVFALTLDR